MRRGMVFIVLFSLVMGTTFGQSLQSLQQELQTVQKSLDQAEGKLDTLKISEQKNSVLITQLKQNIKSGKQAYTTATFQAQRASAYVEASQEKLLQNQPLVDNLRIDLMYNIMKYYQLTTLSPVTLSDYSRYREADLLKQIILKEQAILNGLGATQSQWQQVNDTNKTLESEQLALVSQLESEQSNYQSQIRVKSSEIDGLKKSKVALAQKVSELQKKESNLESQIASIIQQNGGSYQVASKGLSSVKGSTTVKNGMIAPIMNVGQVKSVLGPMILPINGTIKVSFGQQKALNYGVKSVSRGIEIAGSSNMVVQASWSGKVIYAAPLGTLGTVVILDNGSSVATVYGNLDSSSVSVGEVIKKGTPLGNLSSGKNGAILYFEVRFKGVPVNPKDFI